MPHAHTIMYYSAIGPDPSDHVLELWNHEPKYIFLPFKWIISNICHGDRNYPQGLNSGFETPEHPESAILRTSVSPHILPVLGSDFFAGLREGLIAIPDAFHSTL